MERCTLALPARLFDGPQKGAQLEFVPTLVSDWGEWLKRYPHAVAYHMFDKYKPVELSNVVMETQKESPGGGPAFAGRRTCIWRGNGLYATRLSPKGLGAGRIY